jgi:hypothetical protein
MPIGGVVKRILVGIQLRRADGGSSSPHAPLSTKGDTAPNEPRIQQGITSDKAPSDARLSRFAMRKVRGIKSIADSLHERIAAHIIPLADLFERKGGTQVKVSSSPSCPVSTTRTMPSLNGT